MNFYQNLDNQMNRIDLNRLYLSLGLFYGPYNGQRVIRRLSSYLYSQFALWYMLFFSFKFGAMFFIDKHNYLSFIVADYFNNEKGNIYKLMILLTVAYTIWTFFLIWMYQRVNRFKRDSFWLTMLPFDYLPVELQKLQDEKLFYNNSLAGISKNQLTSMHRFYYKFTRLTINVLSFMTILMSIAAASIYYFAFSKQYEKEPYFWWVFCGNFVLLSYFIYLAYFITLGMSLNYTYLAILVKLRFKNIRHAFTSLADNPKADARAISEQIKNFNLIVVDMLRINHFWKKTFGINFFMAMVIIFLLTQQTLYGEELFFRVAFIFLTGFLYLSCVVFPLYSASLVNSAVS